MRRIGRFCVTTAGLVLAALALVAPLAQAEPPAVTIASPASGTVTKESSIAFAGTTNDPLDVVTIDVYQGTAAGGTPVREEFASPSEGSWSVQVASPLPDETYTAVARQGTVEVGSSTEVTFRVDTIAPAPTVTGPKAGEALKSPVEFHGAAGNAPGDGAEVTVEVFEGESTAPEALEDSFTMMRSGPSWSSQRTVSEGIHTVRVQQSDSAGNTGFSEPPTTFTIDTVAPSLTLNPIPATIATATPTFGGSGGQAAGDGAVRVFVDGSLAGEVAVVGGAWSLPSAHLGDGTHTVRAEQSDQAGNVSKTGTATFTVDTTAPAPTVTGPKAGETLKSSRVEFRGAAGNASGDGAEVTVEVFKGESTAPEALEDSFTTTRSGSSWNSGGSGPRLSNGTYTVRVKQTDSAGNPGSSGAVVFEVLSPAPSVTLAELSPFINNPTPSFGGSADTSGEAESEVTLKIWRGTSASGSLAESMSGSISGATWSLGPVGALTDGVYTAQAEQPAAQRNPAGVSETTTFTVDTLPPQPTLSAPAESTGLETASGSAGTTPGDRRQVTAELFSGGSAEGAAIETITVLDTADGTWSATFAGLGGGQYTVLARQSDEAGNTGSSAAQSFTVNAPPPPAGPSAPVASFTWVPQTPTVGQSVSLVSKSTDASSAITGYGWDLAGSGPFAAGGPVMTTTFATAGAHTVRLQVIDANGLSSTVAEAIQVAPQALTLMQPFPIVRIAGAETSGGARIKLLSVQAPPGAKVAVSCRGRGCKTKSETRLATASSKSKGKSRAGAITLAFPRFQRTLGAGAMLQIRITKSGQIGKFTSFKIRRRKLPVRVDACLRPPSTAPSPCPSQ